MDTLRVGIFFDGTGNNIWNDVKINDGSQTNIAKLYTLYKKVGHFAEYEEGVGTEGFTEENGITFDDATIENIRNGTLNKVSLYEVGSMVFGSTAKSHVRDMLHKLADIIDNNPDKKILLDVYGFSRGAAEARDFINEVNKIYVNADGTSIVDFVGLFDTVAVIGFEAGYDFSLNLNLSSDSADKIVHLTAQDEIRDKFPLDTFANASGNISEIPMEGVHADIGGGYGVLDDSVQLIVREQTKVADQIFENKIEYWKEQHRLEFERFKALSPNKEYKLVPKVEELEGGLYKLISYTLEQRNIKFGLSNLALKEMYQQITNHGIELPELSELGSIDLGGSLPAKDLWSTPSGPIDDYKHVSAIDNVYERQGLIDWVVNSAEWDGVRDFHTNKPDKAESELLAHSREDNTILYLERPDTYTILGITSEDISKLESHPPRFTQDRATYLELKMKDQRFYTPLFPDESTNDTKYEDKASDETYAGAPVEDVDRVIFATESDDKNIILDQSRWSSSNQIVYGKGGNDLIDTGSGDDHIYGGNGSDHLYGGEGVDIIYGGIGADYLYANNAENSQDDEADNLRGGEGADNYFLSGSDVARDTSGDDTYVINISSDSGEKVVISDLDRIGKLILNGELITTAVAIAEEGKWRAGSATLSKYGSSLIIEDGLSNTVEIINYHEGDLGIELVSMTDEESGSNELLSNEIDDLIVDSGIGRFIDALAGDDVLYFSGLGADIVEGNKGSDILAGGGGDDYLYAGTKNDLLKIFNNAVDTVSSGFDSLSGGRGDDFLVGSRDSNWINGGADNDTVFSGAGDDIIYGDSQEIAANVENYSDAEILIFDGLYSGPLNPDDFGTDYLYAGAGNDAVSGQGGDDYLFGESGDDVLRGDESNLTANGGNITLSTDHHGVDYINGGSGNDTIKGDGGNDHLYGGADNDEIFGDAYDISLFIHGNDHLYGGSGQDLLVGNSGHDRLYGGSDNDILMGDSGNVTSAMIGNDFLDGGQGDDHLEGEGGDDQLIGGEGIDELHGGEGDDTYRFELGDALVINNHIDSIYDAVSENNVIVFGQGIKVTNIELKADRTGVIVEYGDEAIYIKHGDSGAINLFEFEETGQTISFDELMSERFLGDREVYGTNTDDVLTGGAGTNRLVGGEGNDRLVGGSGNSVLEGGTGNDILISRGGYDSLYGGEGDDRYEITTRDATNVLIADQSGSNSLIMRGIYDEQETYFNLVDDDLIIVTGSSQITIQNWESSGFTSYQLSDGTTLSSSDVNARLNTAPIALGPQALEVDEDSLVEIDLVTDLFNDPEADELSFIIKQADGSGLPAWLTFNAETRSLSGTPENSDVGHLSLIVEAIDPAGLSATNTLSIDVHNTNDAPVAVADLIVPVSSTPELDYSVQLGSSPGELRKAETWIEKHGDGTLVFWKIYGTNDAVEWKYQKLDSDGSAISEVASLDLQGAELIRVYSTENQIKILSKRIATAGEPYEGEQNLYLQAVSELLEISDQSFVSTNNIPSDDWLYGHTIGGTAEVVWSEGDRHGVLWQVSGFYDFYFYSVSNTATLEQEYGSYSSEYAYGASDVSVIRLSDNESLMAIGSSELLLFNKDFDPERADDNRYRLPTDNVAALQQGGKHSESYAFRQNDGHLLVISEFKIDQGQYPHKTTTTELYYSIINTNDNSYSSMQQLTEFADGNSIIDVDYYTGEGVEQSVFITFAQENTDGLYELKGRFISSAGEQIGPDLLLSSSAHSSYRVFSDQDYNDETTPSVNHEYDQGDISYNTIVREGEVLSVWSTPEGVNVSSVMLNSQASDYFEFDPLVNDYDVDLDNSEETIELVKASLIEGVGQVSVEGGKVIYDGQDGYKYLPDDQQSTVTIEYTIRDQAGAESSSTITVNLNGKLDNNSFSDYVVFNPFSSTTDSVVTSDANDYVQIDYNRVEDEVVAQGKNYAIDLGAGDDVITFNGIGYSGYGSIPYAGFIWNITGGLGNDSFVILGDNYDTIYINDPTGDNQLIFTVPAQHYGLSSNGLSTNLDLVPTLSYGSLKLTFDGLETEIHLENFNPDDVLGGPRDISYFEFNGVGYTYEELISLGFDLTGDADDNLITGTSVVDRIYGRAGNDLLAGGAGNDSYFFNAGDGHDVIVDNHGLNRLVLGDGITLDDLEFSTSGDDLIISINENDSVTIKDWKIEKGSSISAITSGIEIISTADIESRLFSFDAIPELHFTEDEAISGINLRDYLTGYEGMFSAELVNVETGEASDWLNVDSATGELAGTPLNEHVGSGRYLLRVTLETGEVVEQEITYTVQNTNDSPQLNSGINDLSVSLAEDIDISIPDDLFRDVDVGDELNIAITLSNGEPLPDWLLYHAERNTISGVGYLEQLGSYQLQITASDIAGKQATASFSLRIDPGEGSILGSEEGDWLFGNCHSDSKIFGGAGEDKLFGLLRDDRLFGGSGNDKLIAGIGNNTLYGGSGNDLIFAGAGNDHIDAGLGDDIVYAGAGDDFIVMGQGRDVLHGSRGNDQYIVSQNCGTNWIKEGTGKNDSYDVVEFVGPITGDQLWFSQQENDLRIHVIGTEDTVYIDNWFKSENSRIEAIKAGGETLEYASVESLVQAMASFDAPSGEGEELPSYVKERLQPVLASSWQRSE